MSYPETSGFLSKLSPLKKKLVVLTCLSLALSVSYLGYLLFLDSVLESKLGKIRKAGYPTNTEELDKFYTKIPDNENAAIIYGEAFANYQDNPPGIDKNLLVICGFAQMPSDTEPLDQEKKDTSVRYLAKNAKALELLHKAAKFQKTRFNFDFYNWTNVKLFSSLRQGARLLEMEGFIALENSDSEKFLESVKDSVALSCSLDEMPIIISVLVQYSAQSLSLEEIQRALIRNTFTDEQLHAMYDAFGRYEESRTLRRAFIGERSFAIKWEQLFYSRIFGLDRTNCIGYLDILSESVDICGLPPEEMLRRSKELKKKIKDLPFYMYECKNTSSGLMNVFDKKCLALANVACNRAGLAVERYRLKYGKLPEKLFDLKAEFIENVPLDPFDGKELRYKKLPKGYMIYSIGSDCVDNGGTPESLKRYGYQSGTDTTIMIGK
ncbi:MAG TPA: hypothetical protein DET40_18535 [Lentisphaeria bacterium]|nr:MAG: hypothetical protein A2X45_14675 [Lentisphaerae bacterium GWF2_50_93]HCE45542.1 hypothetical protein [Lentisphaeria bacterium]